MPALARKLRTPQAVLLHSVYGFQKAYLKFCPIRGVSRDQQLENDLQECTFKDFAMTPDDRRIARVFRRVLRTYGREIVTQAVQDGLKSHESKVARLLKEQEWCDTEQAAELIRKANFKCKADYVRSDVVKHRLIVKKRTGTDAGGLGKILISRESIEAYIAWRRTPTKEFDDIAPELIEKRKIGQAKAQAKRKNNQKRA